MSTTDKFVKINGILKKNPNYRGAGSSAATSVAHPEVALAVVSCVSDVTQQHAPGGPMIVLSEATQSAMEIVRDAEYTEAIPMRPDQRATLPHGDAILRLIGEQFAQYETPIGLIGKLLELIGRTLIFRIDDSGSMGARSKLSIEIDSSVQLQSRARNNRRCCYDRTDLRMTVWEEAEDRMHKFVDLLTYIPTGPIHLRFFDSSRNVSLLRDGTTFAEWATAAHIAVSACFDRAPATGTPLGKCAREDLYSGNQEVHMVYWLTDGSPSDIGVDELKRLIIQRPNPHLTPLSLLTCGDDAIATKWMKDLEECKNALFVSEVDDFVSEREEVEHDQGKVFPYTRGMHMICQLVGCINPTDLDAVDDARPLSRLSMETIFGRQISEQEFSAYWNAHPIAARVYQMYFSQMFRDAVIGNQLLPEYKKEKKSNRAY